MRIGTASQYASFRNGIIACYWETYLDAMEKIGLQAEKHSLESNLALTREEQIVFNYFNRGDTSMIQDKDEYTKDQKEFLRRKYINAYICAMEKVKTIESLGSEAYNGYNLKPEYAFTHFEVAAMRLEENYPGILSDSSVRTKRI